MTLFVKTEAFSADISGAHAHFFEHSGRIEHGVEDVPDFLLAESFPMLFAGFNLLLDFDVILFVVELHSVAFTSKVLKSVQIESSEHTLHKMGRYRLVHSTFFPMLSSLSLAVLYM